MCTGMLPVHVEALLVTLELIFGHVPRVKLIECRRHPHHRRLCRLHPLRLEDRLRQLQQQRAAQGTAMATGLTLVQLQVGVLGMSSSN